MATPAGQDFHAKRGPRPRKSKACTPRSRPFEGVATASSCGPKFQNAQAAGRPSCPPPAPGKPGAVSSFDHEWLCLMVCLWTPSKAPMVVGQNQWYHFGVGAPPILVCLSGDWDVHWRYGLLPHGQMSISTRDTFWTRPTRSSIHHELLAVPMWATAT